MTTTLQPVPVVPDTSDAVGRYGADSDTVLYFLNGLRRIPAFLWVQAAESAQPADVSDAEVTLDGEWDNPVLHPIIEEQLHFAARHRLHAALETMPQVVRRISDKINHELAVVQAFVPEAVVQRMRRVTNLAAFALAAHHLLPQEDVDRLYRPFASLIPGPQNLQLG